MRSALLYLTLFGILAIAVWNFPFGGFWEKGWPDSRPITYSQYTSGEGQEFFDPVGGSEIQYGSIQHRDGYECWWKFRISEPDLMAVAANTASRNLGPEQLVWHPHGRIPPNWIMDDDPPPWWSLTIDSDSVRCTNWCYDYIDEARHKGWFFKFDRDTDMAYCWHWNHQWSDQECLD